MNKNASEPVKSVLDFAKTLKKSGIKGNFKGIIDNAMFEGNGTGSMILDFLTRNKAGTSNTYKNFQRKLTDMDMKVGGKAYDFLDKKKSSLANSLKNSLVQEHDILKRKGINNLPDEFIKVKTTGILNPISKTKDKVLPVIGSMTVANHLLANRKKDGDYDG